MASAASVRLAADALSAEAALASYVERPLPEHVAKSFRSYLASRPTWPDTEHLHPMEATHDRIAIIDFSRGDTLDSAIGYGRNLPPRHSAVPAGAAIAHVLSVLPSELATVATLDAIALLDALRRETGRRQYILRLELVLGDTCRRWHRDLNICRCIVTYGGPGTEVAHEDGVTREADGSVSAVDEERVLRLGSGAFLLMKGGLWPGSDGGAAHRAPAIGPVPTCDTHRLLLKVDVSEDF